MPATAAHVGVVPGEAAGCEASRADQEGEWRGGGRPVLPEAGPFRTHIRLDIPPPSTLRRRELSCSCSPADLRFAAGTCRRSTWRPSGSSAQGRCGWPRPSSCCCRRPPWRMPSAAGCRARAGRTCRPCCTSRCRSCRTCRASPCRTSHCPPSGCPRGGGAAGGRRRPSQRIRQVLLALRSS